MELEELKEIFQSRQYLDKISKLSDDNLLEEIIDLNIRIESLENYIQYLKDKAT